MNEELKKALSEPPIDILGAIAAPPPPIEFVLPALARKTVGVLSAPGSTGKSMFALMAAMAVAGGKPVADALGIATALSDPEPVLVLAAEDPEDILKHRIHAIGKRLPSVDWSCLHVIPLAGVDVDIQSDKDVIIGCVRKLRPSLIIVDTLSRVLSGAPENDNAIMSQVINSFTNIAKAENSAVLVLHHVNKDAALSGRGLKAQAARGASAIIDNARFGASMSVMTDDEAKIFADRELHPNLSIADRNDAKSYVCYVVNKHNYSEALPKSWYRRQNDGVLVPARLKEVADKGKSTQSAPPTKFAELGEPRQKPTVNKRREKADRQRHA